MTRIDAIKEIMSCVTNEVVIASNGMISREVYQVKDRPLNFYMLGSMGAGLAIGIGIAYTRPDIKVIVISGDGAVLMSLGTLALQKKLAMRNLRHFILDNHCHATTGKQPTISDCVNFELIGGDGVTVCEVSNETGDAPRVPLNPREITARFKDAISNLQQKEQEIS